VSLKNPNPYSLVVKADARHTKGFLSCDRDPREILEIAANGVVQLQCTASWQAAIDRLGRPRSAAQMDVYERSHTFRCIRGCTLKDSWPDQRDVLNDDCGHHGPFGAQTGLGWLGLPVPRYAIAFLPSLRNVHTEGRKTLKRAHFVNPVSAGLTQRGAVPQYQFVVKEDGNG